MSFPKRLFVFSNQWHTVLLFFPVIANVILLNNMPIKLVHPLDGCMELLKQEWFKLEILSTR